MLKKLKIFNFLRLTCAEKRCCVNPALSGAYVWIDQMEEGQLNPVIFGKVSRSLVKCSDLNLNNRMK